MTNAESNEKIAMRVSRRSIYGNLALSAFKLFAGIFAHSAAMISDAAESLSDVFSTIVVMTGIKMAAREPDKDHPYGHERFEPMAALVLSAILFATGAGIGWMGLVKIISGRGGADEIPGITALIAAAIVVAAKEGMYWYTRAAAKKTGSGALMANAWHHRSDALSSIGSFAGILGARLGLPILDPAVCVLTCLFVLKAAIDIARDAASKMTDRSCDDSVLEEMRGVILAQGNIERIDLLKTRLFGDRIYVDAEIAFDGAAPLSQAHEAAQRVHDAVEERFPRVKHCMVHVNPAEPKAP